HRRVPARRRPEPAGRRSCAGAPARALHGAAHDFLAGRLHGRPGTRELPARPFPDRALARRSGRLPPGRSRRARARAADPGSRLARRSGWHPHGLEDVLPNRQPPKIHAYTEDGYPFAVLHFPVYDKAVQRLNAAELDFFTGQDYLVTFPTVELLPVTRLFRRCEEDAELRDQLFSKGSGYLLYHVLDDLFDYCFPILDKIGHKLDSLEDALFEERAED